MYGVVADTIDAAIGSPPPGSNVAVFDCEGHELHALCGAMGLLMQVDHVAALIMCCVSHLLLLLLLLLLEEILHTFSAAADTGSGGRCACAGHRVFALHNAQVFTAIISYHPLHLPRTVTIRIQSLCIIALSLLYPSSVPKPKPTHSFIPASCASTTLALPCTSRGALTHACTSRARRFSLLSALGYSLSVMDEDTGRLTPVTAADAETFNKESRLGLGIWDVGVLVSISTCFSAFHDEGSYMRGKGSPPLQMTWVGRLTHSDARHLNEAALRQVRCRPCWRHEGHVTLLLQVCATIDKMTYEDDGMSRGGDGDGNGDGDGDGDGDGIVANQAKAVKNS